MLNLKFFAKIGLFLYIFIYLIFPNSAITNSTKIDIKNNLENALNSRDLKFIKDNFSGDESLKIIKKFSEIITEFPNAKWQIKRLDKQILKIKVVGNKMVNKEKYAFESNFKYFFSKVNGKISSGSIKNLLTTIRNDKNKIDIIFKIPDKVLTGKKYDIDIILIKPLGEVIVAGGVKSHQDESYLKQEIDLEPLVAGGIFKMTRAPSKPTTQVWSGIISHPKGIVTFTKSVEVVEKI